MCIFEQFIWLELPLQVITNRDTLVKLIVKHTGNVYSLCPNSHLQAQTCIHAHTLLPFISVLIRAHAYAEGGHWLFVLIICQKRLQPQSWEDHPIWIPWKLKSLGSMIRWDYSTVRIHGFCVFIVVYLELNNLRWVLWYQILWHGQEKIMVDAASPEDWTRNAGIKVVEGF